MDWSKDIIKNKSDQTEIITFRISKKYKDFIKKHKIDTKKLVMRACEELNHSLKDD